MATTRSTLYARLDGARQALLPLIDHAADSLPMPQCMAVLESLTADAKTIGDCCELVYEGIRKYGEHSAPRWEDKEAVDNVILAVRGIGDRLKAVDLDTSVVDAAVKSIREVERTASAIASILEHVPAPDMVRSRDVDGTA